MRLYQTEGGAWFGSQREASLAAFDEGRSRSAWKAVDFPTGKADTLDWLNKNCGPASHEAREAERELDRLREREAERITREEIARSDGLIKPVFDGKAALDRSIKIDEVIQAADLQETIRLFDQVAWRMNEHRRAIEAKAIQQ